MKAKKKNKRFRYTATQLKFLRAGYRKMNIEDLTPAFNRRFGTDKTEGAIKAALENHKIRCGRKGKDKLVKHRLRNFTEEQIEFIRKHYSGRSVAEMTDVFNEKFKTTMTRQQIKTAVQNRHITSGRTGCFEKGHKPWNAGTKGQGLTGPNSGTFKKGNIPPNRKPLWSERVDTKDGYILMKVPEKNPYTGFPTRYKPKHVWIWEQAHGPIPDGHVLLFMDQDRNHIDLENLTLITYSERARLCQLKYGDACPEVRPSLLALARLKAKIGAKEHES